MAQSVPAEKPCWTSLRFIAAHSSHATLVTRKHMLPSRERDCGAFKPASRSCSSIDTPAHVFGVQLIAIRSPVVR